MKHKKSDKIEEETSKLITWRFNSRQIKAVLGQWERTGRGHTDIRVRWGRSDVLEQNWILEAVLLSLAVPLKEGIV